MRPAQQEKSLDAARTLLSAYFAAFNRQDMVALESFYHPDCRFVTRPGFSNPDRRAAILSFYRTLWSHADETIVLRDVTVAGGEFVAEIETRIVAHVDMPDFGTDGLTAGQCLVLCSRVGYRIEACRITAIRGREVLSRSLTGNLAGEGQRAE